MIQREFDAVVVGSGAGGSAAAYQMVRAGLRVALLEKGPRLPKDGSTLDIQRVVRQGEFLSREIWQDGSGNRFAPEEHFNLGGKTKWYGAALARFAPHEFAAEPQFGLRAWPIAYEDLEPYYAIAEELLGVRNFPIEPDLARIVDDLTQLDSGWSSQALPLALAPAILHNTMEARHFDGFASVRSLKADAEHSLLARIAGDPRLTLLVNQEVVALVGASDDSRRIVGVQTLDGCTLSAKRVLLAAGALHSPRLLQRYLAGAGLTSRLRSASSVGRNLKLHLLTAMVSVSTKTKTDLLRKTTLLLNERLPHSSVQALGFDGELIATLMPKLLPAKMALAVGARAYGFFLQTEDGSDSRNRVSDDSPPVFDYDRRRLPAAVSEHRRLTRTLQRDLLRAGLVSFTKRIGLAGTAHACGTLVAGADPDTSVVSATGAVHEMTGLYVVDGSVLPRSSRVNPALSIYAWGLRVGEQIVNSMPNRNSHETPATLRA